MPLRTRSALSGAVAATVPMAAASACVMKNSGQGPRNQATMSGKSGSGKAELGDASGTKVALVRGGAHPYFQPWKTAGAEAKKEYQLGDVTFDETADWDQQKQNNLFSALAARGPVSAVTPQLGAVDRAPSLPFASTLCGACYDACPVRINLPEVLAHLRAEVVECTRRGRRLPTRGAVAMKAVGAVLDSPAALAAAQRAGRVATRLVGRDGRIRWLPGPFSGWSDARDTVSPQAESSRTWWRKNREQ
ncbi:hypothetical protein ACFU6I_34515 [Streptomyces sp. NPDC057486]|uniref:hypothetical protein n=1 Tax=Streptomyces sp. NPDC057486 TaxID=3346145 RepID=UPI003683BD86